MRSVILVIFISLLNRHIAIKCSFAAVDENI
jgi:hypothetical protein